MVQKMSGVKKNLANNFPIPCLQRKRVSWTADSLLQLFLHRMHSATRKCVSFGKWQRPTYNNSQSLSAPECFGCNQSMFFSCVVVIITFTINVSDTGGCCCIFSILSIQEWHSEGANQNLHFCPVDKLQLC